MCKKSIIYISFFCSVFFLSPVYSAGENNCNPKYISEKLVELGLSPTIRNNAQLLNGIEHEYGARFRSELIKKFPLLGEDHLNKIDLKTLKWVDETGFFGKFSPGTQYLFSPFHEVSNQRKGAKLMANRLLPLTYQKTLARPIILNSAQLKAVDAAFYSGGTYSNRHSAFRTIFLILFRRRYLPFRDN